MKRIDMAKIKLCSRELQGLEIHFRLIREKFLAKFLKGRHEAQEFGLTDESTTDRLQSTPDDPGKLETQVDPGTLKN